jgi:hypothetical protein
MIIYHSHKVLTFHLAAIPICSLSFVKEARLAANRAVCILKKLLKETE